MSSWNCNWCLEWCVSHWHFESEAKHEHIVQTQQIHPKHIHQPILWWLYFFHVAPHSPKAWKIFGLPSNFALHLGNAMTKLNVNIFGMSRWQIQPMKYQRPRAHETDMDRWSLFDLLLILDHHLLEVPLADLGYRDVQGEQHGGPSHCWVLEDNFKMIKCSWLDNLSQDLLCLLHHWLAILLGALTESWLRSRPLWCTWCKMDSIETIYFSKMNHLWWWTDSSWSLKVSNHQGT